jgi:hypothetical protein
MHWTVSFLKVFDIKELNINLFYPPGVSEIEHWGNKSATQLQLADQALAVGELLIAGARTSTLLCDNFCPPSPNCKDDY